MHQFFSDTKKPFLNDPSALQSSASDPALLGAVFPALYASVITNNPPMYNWLVTLPNQCIVDQGYIQPVAVILTQGTMFETIGVNLPKLVDDYYNAGCTTEQLWLMRRSCWRPSTCPPRSRPTQSSRSSEQRRPASKSDSPSPSTGAQASCSASRQVSHASFLDSPRAIQALTRLLSLVDLAILTSVFAIG